MWIISQVFQHERKILQLSLPELFDPKCAPYFHTFVLFLLLFSPSLFFPHSSPPYFQILFFLPNPAKTLFFYAFRPPPAGGMLYTSLTFYFAFYLFILLSSPFNRLSHILITFRFLRTTLVSSINPIKGLAYSSLSKMFSKSIYQEL